MELSVLDLFGGLGGWSQAFLDRGHQVQRVDNDEKFLDVPWTTVEDVLTYRPREEFDVVLASPPCQAFSLGAGGTHITTHADCQCGSLMMKQHEKWFCPCGEPRMVAGTMRLEPCSEFGKLSIRLVERTLELIDIIKPRYWWMENPNGGMIHFVPESVPRVQVSYCRYGERRKKDTNLWGSWPDTWVPRPKCDSRPKGGENVNWVGMVLNADGFPCHEWSPRGAKTGTQGIKGAALRALVPYELSLEVCVAVEQEMEGAEQG